MAKKKMSKIATPAAPKKAPLSRSQDRTGAKSVQPRTWRKMNKLTADALAALAAGDLKLVKSHLEALQAVATCAEAIE